jgi:hypothetical protein
MAVPEWGKSPRDSIARECERRGKDELVAGCMALLRGQSVDPELVYALGGPPASWVWTGTEPGPDYWLRVWALRGLLWAWDAEALGCIMTSLDDEAWRVREAALKVVGRHRLGAANTKVASMRDDPSSRVASAAHRVHVRLSESHTGPGS